MAIITNRKAKHDFNIVSKISAGISLLGTEVKSIKKGSVSLVGANVMIKNNEAFLVGANIPPFQPKNEKDSYDPKRERRLLLTKKEIQNLVLKTEAKNLYLIPLSIYSKGINLKLEIGVGAKMNPKDKREKIKKRDSDRETKRLNNDLFG